MGHIQDRWYRPKLDPDTGMVALSAKGKPVLERTELYGKGMRYKVRYLDPDGEERSKSFPDKQKKRAEDFLIEVESDKREGKYVDPRAGRVSFRSVSKRWVDAQTFDYTTRERVKSRVVTHLVPFFEGRSIGSIKPSDVQAWLRWLQDQGVATRSRVLYFAHLVSIFSFARDDKLIVTNPAQSKSVTRPREDASRVQPWPGERARAVLDAMPDRYKPTVRLAAGLGLRSGRYSGSPSTTSTGSVTSHGSSGRCGWSTTNRCSRFRSEVRRVRYRSGPRCWKTSTVTPRSSPLLRSPCPGGTRRANP